jgi:prepilin-type N-terminal cleavage/methylation domain-containing protein
MNKKRQGFTLIELLVVIAIIGLLSTLAIVSLNTARQKSRNTKRQADIRTLQSAMELYINEAGVPPTLPANWLALGTTLSAYLASSTPPAPPGTPDCDNAVATGPATTDCYMLCINSETAGAESYLLAAHNENAANIDGDVDSNFDYDADQCILSGGVGDNVFEPLGTTCADPVFCLGR